MFTNLPSVLAALRRAGDAAKDAAAEAMAEEAAGVYRRSQELVPVLTGELKNSGYIGPTERQGDTVRVEVGYRAAHATVVHEDLEASHPTGQSKFLEQAVNEAEAGAARRIADRISQGMRRAR